MKRKLQSEGEELRQVLPTQIAIISPSVEQLMRFIARFRKEDGSAWDIETALREALANAMLHGNQQDAHKHVYVACRCTPDGEVSITVRDEGSGFESGIVPDPTAPDNRLLSSGRGIYLMRMLMDEVRFEQDGALVFMRKNPNPDPVQVCNHSDSDASTFSKCPDTTAAAADGLRNGRAHRIEVAKADAEAYRERSNSGACQVQIDGCTADNKKLERRGEHNG